MTGKRITREEWGAEAPNGGPGLLEQQRVVGLALHWPGDAGRLRGVAEVSAHLRSWQHYHMHTKGWSDIAYQGAVDQDGNYYELRGLWTQSGANGDEDVNERYGALLLVVAAGEYPSAAMIDTVRDTVARHRDRFPHSERIVPHSAIRPEATACPGDIVRGLISRDVFEPQADQGPTPTHVHRARQRLAGVLRELDRVPAGTRPVAEHVAEQLRDLYETLPKR